MSPRLKMVSGLVSNEESTIEFLNLPEGRFGVKKTYLGNKVHIKWLNEALSKYYDSQERMPVISHECAAIKLLSKYGIVPEIYESGYDYLIMSYEGNSLCLDWWKTRKQSYVKKAANILNILSEVGFKHNDLIPSNVLLHKGKLTLIDFSWAEFNNIDITSDMPQKNWCHKGEDTNLTLYLDYKYKIHYLRRAYRLIKSKCESAVRKKAKKFICHLRTS